MRHDRAGPLTSPRGIPAEAIVSVDGRHLKSGLISCKFLDLAGRKFSGKIRFTNAL